MAFLKTTYNCFLKRPFLLIYIAAFSLLYSLLHLLNPLMGLLQSLGALGTDSWTDSMVYISKELYSIANISIILPAAAIAVLILAVLAGVLTAGFMNLYYETLTEGRGNIIDTILDGIKKFFIKISLIYFQFFLSITAIVLLVPLATVPSIILTQKAIENGSENFLTTGFLTGLTLVVLFLIIAFTTMAFVFRFPSVFYFKKRPFEKSKTVVSSAYWRYFAPVCLLVALFIGTEILLLIIKSNFLEFITGWVFYFLLLTSVSAVTFTGYTMMLRKFKRN